MRRRPLLVILFRGELRLMRDEIQGECTRNVLLLETAKFGERPDSKGGDSCGLSFSDKRNRI